MKGRFYFRLLKIMGTFLLFLPALSFGEVIFQENFEDTNFGARGWYDNTNLQLSTVEHVSGSTKSAQFRWLAGGTQPTSGGAMRRIFTATDLVYVSYYVKYSANYTGSNKPYHPHEFYLLTNLSTNFNNLAYTNLTAYFEHNEGVPILRLQDGKNIDETKIGLNLLNITESRSVAGCNGNSDGYDIRGPFGDGDCYLNGSVHWNGKQWKAGEIYFSDSSGPRYKNDWHFIEVFFKLNSIVGGKGIPDGVMKYWYDGALIMDYNNVMMRTGQHPNMKFNQFVIGPYIGDGSPVDQSFWIDNLTVATTRVGADTPPSPPQNLLVQ